jgi:hypothetical protein
MSLKNIRVAGAVLAIAVGAIGLSTPLRGQGHPAKPVAQVFPTPTATPTIPPPPPCLAPKCKGALIGEPGVCYNNGQSTSHWCAQGAIICQDGAFTCH